MDVFKYWNFWNSLNAWLLYHRVKHIIKWESSYLPEKLGKFNFGKRTWFIELTSAMGDTDGTDITGGLTLLLSLPFEQEIIHLKLAVKSKNTSSKATRSFSSSSDNVSNSNCTLLYSAQYSDNFSVRSSKFAIISGVIDRIYVCFNTRFNRRPLL